MTRSMRFAFRTLVGPWLLFPALAFGIAVSLLRSSPWLGEGFWTVEWFGLSMFYLLPFVMGAAAVDAARANRAGVGHLQRTAGRGSRILPRIAAWSALPVAGVHGGTMIVGLVVGHVTAPSAGWSSVVLAIVIQLAGLLWAAGVGCFLGTVAPPAPAAVAAIVIGFVGVQFIGEAAGRGSFHLLSFGASSVSRIGWVLNPAYASTQLGVFIGVGAVLVLGPAVLRGSWAVRRLAVGIITVLALLALPLLGPGQRLLADPRPPTDCSGGKPVLCIYPENARQAPGMPEIINRLMVLAQQRGYGAIVPERIEAQSRTYTTPPRRGVLPLDIFDTSITGGRYTVEYLVQTLFVPVGCAALRGDVGPPDSYGEQLDQLSATWLALWYGQAPPLSPADAAALTDRFARCDFSLPA